MHDRDKRDRYDRFGHAGVEGASGGSQFHDINDIFEAFGDMFGGGIFSDLSNPFDATRYHSLVIERESLPDCLEVTAWTQLNGEYFCPPARNS